MSTSSIDPASVAMTTEDIRKNINDELACDIEIANLQERKKMIAQWLAAAAIVNPRAVEMVRAEVFTAAQPSPPPQSDEGRDNSEDSMARGQFGDDIVRILRKAYAPLLPIAIREQLREMGHGAQLERSPNYFYTSLARLLKRGRVVKVGEAYTAS